MTIAQEIQEDECLAQTLWEACWEGTRGDGCVWSGLPDRDKIRWLRVARKAQERFGLTSKKTPAHGQMPNLDAELNKIYGERRPYQALAIRNAAIADMTTTRPLAWAAGIDEEYI